MSYNNRPIRKYRNLEALVSKFIGPVSGVWGWIVSTFWVHAFRYAASRGVHLIDVTDTIIVTTMDEQTFVRVTNQSYEKVEAGNLTPEQGADVDNAFIKAFDNFVVFKKVLR